MWWFSLVYCSLVMLSLAFVFVMSTWRRGPTERAVGVLFAALWVMSAVAIDLTILLRLGWAVPLWLVLGMVVPLLSLAAIIFAAGRYVPTA